jgi:Protein of unknown function (DUF3592)
VKIIVIVKYAFAAIGIAMLSGAFFLYQNTSSFLAKAVKVDGAVIENVRKNSNGSTTYWPVIQFTDSSGANVEFTSASGSNPASYSEGDTVEVVYSPDEPEKAKIKSFFPLWGAATIVGGIGFVFSLIGGGMMVFGFLKNRKTEYLKTYGVQIQAEFKSVERNSALSVNDQHPYQIVAQWLSPSTGELHIFQSDNIWFDPTDYVKTEKVRVYIERDNPKKYLMDISFLPKLAE